LSIDSCTQENIERESALHLEADAASVISCREGKPDFVKPYSTCVAQIVEICDASSQMSQIWACISASLFCHSHSAAQHNVTSCNHHTNRIPCLDSLENYGWYSLETLTLSQSSSVQSHDVQLLLSLASLSYTDLTSVGLLINDRAAIISAIGSHNIQIFSTFAVVVSPETSKLLLSACQVSIFAFSPLNFLSPCDLQHL
jgi:hypothetical protein